MKKLILVLLSLAIFSCSSDDASTDKQKNTFSVNGKEYETSLGFRDNHSGGSGYYEIIFSNLDLSNSIENGTLNSASILFSNDDITEGTYTFLLDDDANYNSSKNFFDGTGAFGLEYKDGKADTTGNNFYEIIKSGTVTITKTNDTYSFDYTIEFEKGTIKGSYTGEIKTIQSRD